VASPKASAASKRGQPKSGEPKAEKSPQIRAKGIYLKKQSKRSAPKSTQPQPAPSEPVKPQENSLFRSLLEWLKKRLGLGK
jgi:hypothetical protein